VVKPPKNGIPIDNGPLKRRIKGAKKMLINDPYFLISQGSDLGVVYKRNNGNPTNIIIN